MNFQPCPSNSGNQPPEKEIQGLKVQKTSHKVKKPQPQIPPQHRPPVIIYTVSPTVIHTNPSDFRSLVQRLTRSIVPASSLQQELQPKSTVDEMISEPGPGPGRVGILSPGPGAMPTIPSGLVTPPCSAGLLHGLSPMVGGCGGQNRNNVNNAFLLSSANLFSGQTMSRSYMDEFKRYSSSFNPHHYVRARYREIEEQRRMRKPQEARDWQKKDDRSQSSYDDRHKQDKGEEEDSRKRRRDRDDRGKDYGEGDSHKRSNQDINPMNKEDMLKDLGTVKGHIEKQPDVVKDHIEKLPQWQKPDDELEQVNKINLQAMLTMENDKAEWNRTLQARDASITSLSQKNQELEAENQRLKEEIAVAKRWETLLTTQVKDAHFAQKIAEDLLANEQRTFKTYQQDNTSLREKNTSQESEISSWKAKAEALERERDQALSGKAAAERAYDEAKAEHDSTMFRFYTVSVMGRGSLSFLREVFPITLAEVWDAVLTQFEGRGCTEEELLMVLLDDESRDALARGKEQRMRERGLLVGAGSFGEQALDATATATHTTSADIHVSDPQDLITPSIVPSVSHEEKEEGAEEYLEDDKCNDDNTDDYGAELRSTRATDKTEIDQDLSNWDFMFTSPGHRHDHYLLALGLKDASF